jgi:hypothetical protein
MKCLPFRSGVTLSWFERTAIVVTIALLLSPSAGILAQPTEHRMFARRQQPSAAAEAFADATLHSAYNTQRPVLIKTQLPVLIETFLFL